jgi:tetratricopeptide (TPR) repeat protein
MPIDLSIRPSISEHKLKVLSRLRAEFDRKIENPKEKWPTHKEIIAVGTNLWEALINSLDGGMDKLLALREQAIAEQTYLRLIIESDHPAIRALPWELTFHVDKRLEFLSHNPAFSLLRRLRQSDEKMPDLPALPLKILLFIASPENLDQESARLDFENEENFLFQQLDDALSNGLVEVEVAEDGSLETLQKKLENAVYHVVHLSMHGHMREGDAVLYFENRDTGSLRYVAPDQLIEVLSKAKQPVPCVLLAACQTAQPDTQRAVPDYARALLEAGVPHVIGMRRSVGDTEATYFAGYFYRALAAGKEVDRAVAEARQALSAADVYLQWSIPVLYSRKQNLACVDAQKLFQPSPRMQTSKIQIGELLFEKEGFIGRRTAIRRYYREWASGKNRHLLLYGIGGVGKTALAGHFTLRLQRENPAIRIFAFAAPFNFVTIEEQLRATFLECATEKEIAKRQILDNPLERLVLMMITITARVPCLFIFDNLESCFDLQSQKFLAEHAATEEIIATILYSQAPTWSIVTSRFPSRSDKFTNLTLAELPDASIGDILRFMRKWNWPRYVLEKEKREIYQSLGGNFRSVEWLSGLLSDPKHTWKSLQALLQTVIEAMRRDLIFDELVKLLTPPEKLLLQRLCLEQRPLIIDSVKALWDGSDDVETAISHLTGYRLLETAISPELNVPTYRVPSLVVELLARCPLSEEMQRDTHARLGRHWRFLAKEQTHLLNDDLTAFEHFLKAGLQEEADELLSGLSYEFGRRHEFSRVVELLEPFIQRGGEAAPGWALNRLGLSLVALGKSEAALQCYLQAQKQLEAAQTTMEKQQLGTTLNNISQIYELWGDYPKALQYLKKSLTIDQEIGARASAATVFNNIAMIYDAQGDYDKALRYLKKSLAIMKETKNRRGESTTLNNIGLNYSARGDFNKALKYFKKSLAICREIDDLDGEATALNNIGQFYEKRGNYAQAFEYLDKSLEIREKIGNRKGEGSTLDSIGNVYQARGDYETALKCFEKSLAIKREIGDRRGENVTLNNMAATAYAKGNYRRTLKYLKQSRLIQREIGDLPNEAATLNNMALVANALGNYRRAFSYYKRSLAISQKIGDPTNESITLNNVAEATYAHGDYDKALKFFKQSLRISRKNGSFPLVCTALNNISYIYKARGYYEKALKYLEKSLALSQEIGDRNGEGRTLNNIGEILRMQGDYIRALEYLEKSMEIQREIGDREGIGTTLHNMGLVKFGLGEYDQAMQYFEKSLAINQETGHRAGMISTLYYIALIYLEEEKFEDAGIRLLDALEISEETNNAQGLFNVSLLLGRLLCMSDQKKHKEYGVQLLHDALEVGQKMEHPNISLVEELLQEYS